MPKKEIIVNAEDRQTRIALVEDDELVELYIENPEHKRTIGNICLGRIRKVMPSIQAAFVDIGQEQDAFLHFSDLSENVPQFFEFLKMNEPRVEKVSLPKSDNGNGYPSKMLKRGQKVLVQITKEPISNKGSRITTDLSMAGRFLVLVPLSRAMAVSRKISNAKERRRLKALASSLVPENFGVIVRTVAEGRDAKSLDTDLKLLMERWRRIEAQLAKNPRPPVLLHEDVDMASSIIRDQFSSDYERILIDNDRLYHSVRSYVRAVAPKMVDCVQLHDGTTPIFKAAGVQQGAERAFQERVELPSGGYLFIERTEAMHVVDVNSGRSGRGMSQKQNSLKVNLEAAKVIVQQVRLRDIGGIIVVDFIDLRDEKHRRKVYDALKEGFKEDRAVTKILPMSDFGLVQITRQRLRPSLTTTFSSSNGEIADDETDDATGQKPRPQQSKENRGGGRSSRRNRRRGRRRGGAAQPPETVAAEVRERLEREAEQHRRRAEKLGRRAEELEGEVERLQRELAEREERGDGLAQPAEADAAAQAQKMAREMDDLREHAQHLEKRAERMRDDKERLQRELSRLKREQAEAPPPAAPEPTTPAASATATAPDALVDAIAAWVARYKAEGKRRPVRLRVHPFTAAFLNRPVPAYVTRWFMEHLVRVQVEADPEVAPLAFACEDAQTGQTLRPAGAVEAG